MKTKLKAALISTLLTAGLSLFAASLQPDSLPRSQGYGSPLLLRPSDVFPPEVVTNPYDLARA